MSRLDRILGGLLRAAARTLAPARKDWFEALWAERCDIPAGWPRLSWLAGGLRLMIREAQMYYKSAYVAVFAAGLAGVLWLRSDSGLPLFAAIGLSAIGLMMIGLPWVARRRGMFGPVAGSLAARAARVGGYAALLAFLVVGLGAAQYGNAGRTDLPPHGNGPIWIAISVLWTVYAAGILSATTRGSQVTTATLSIGAGTGVVAGVIVYALTPFSGLLDIADPWLAAAYFLGLVLVILGVPIVAGAVAAARPQAPWITANDPVEITIARARQGTLAGAVCGAAAALVIGVLTLTTLLIVPERVSVEWANPDRNVPHGTPEEIRMSVGDDVQKYQVLLMLGPGIGIMLSSVGAAVQLRERKQPRDGQEGELSTPAAAN
jgi:hypothetical protein